MTDLLPPRPDPEAVRTVWGWLIGLIICAPFWALIVWSVLS